MFGVASVEKKKKLRTSKYSKKAKRKICMMIITREYVHVQKSERDETKVRRANMIKECINTEERKNSALKQIQ